MACMVIAAPGCDCPSVAGSPFAFSIDQGLGIRTLGGYGPPPEIGCGTRWSGLELRVGPVAEPPTSVQAAVAFFEAPPFAEQRNFVNNEELELAEGNYMACTGNWHSVSGTELLCEAFTIGPGTRVALYHTWIEAGGTLDSAAFGPTPGRISYYYLTTRTDPKGGFHIWQDGECSPGEWCFSTLCITNCMFAEE